MRLWTARYQNRTLAEHPAGKVGITLGAPRFRLPYALAATMPELAPTRWMLQKPEAEFTRLYRRLLEQRGGVDLLAERFAEVARTARVDQLALLCFENLTDPAAWCHRRVFSTWYEEQTGEEVPELEESNTA